MLPAVGVGDSLPRGFGGARCQAAVAQLIVRLLERHYVY